MKNYKQSKDVPTETLIKRLNELAQAVTEGTAGLKREFFMSIPVKIDHDADVVLSEAANRLENNAKLIAFANEVINVWLEAEALDAFDIQYMAAIHGLLNLEISYKNCSSETKLCQCAEFSTEEDFNAGVECYRKAGFLNENRECLLSRNDTIKLTGRGPKETR